MFPIGDDHIKGSRTPFLNWIFIVLNVLGFVYELGLTEQELAVFFTNYGVIPVEILQGQNLLSLFTSMFLHGGWMHLIGNMLFLWVFGDNIEHEFGHLKYLLFYLAGGLAASAAHIYFNMESVVPSIGASGAISAVLGAYLVLHPKNKVRVLVFLGFFITTWRVNAFFFLGIWIVQQVISGVASISIDTAQTSGVAWWAHIGGFVFGVAGGFFRRLIR
ncbi:MAG: rhomboid family intramembrane serine protease [Bacteroidia bacterium]